MRRFDGAAGDPLAPPPVDEFSRPITSVLVMNAPARIVSDVLPLPFRSPISTARPMAGDAAVQLAAGEPAPVQRRKSPPAGFTKSGLLSTEPGAAESWLVYVDL